VNPIKTREIQLESPAEFTKRINQSFSNPLLLSRALTHTSYLNENPEAIEDNERLEFLGDAVLDFLVGSWLYNHYPEMREGELTRMRAALVKTEQLAEFAQQIDLGAAIRLGKGEAQAGGRKRKALLCAGFEAFIGALYLDAGLEKVLDFIQPMLVKGSRQILLEHTDRDPKSILQEIVQANGDDPPEYRIVSTTGPEHLKTFVVDVIINGKKYGSGEGHSKRAATKSAARAALENLGMD
jgi:ribonuclease III